MPPMSMLTPTESHPFQSFLEHKDDAVAPEWSYMQPTVINVEDPTQEKNALAKATKDLMSLDPDRWRSSRQPRPSNPPIMQHPGFSAHDVRSHTESNGIAAHHDAGYHHSSAGRRRTEVFPFLTRQSSNASGSSDYHHEPPPSQFQPIGLMHEQYRPDSQYAPEHRAPLPHRPSYPSSRTLSASTSTSVTPPPTSASSSSSTLHSPNPHSDNARSASSSRSIPEKPKRARDKDAVANTSAPSKRPRTTAATKGGLLSPSQKKANHIQSEQKRRANIRRGYEALCDSVPALRAAIQEEEEASEETHGEYSSSRGKSKKGKGAKPKSGDDPGKLDGRAGPRSENVVLGKTIDYLSSLVNEQTSLLQRLDHARSILPPGHPLLEIPSQPPCWERQWTGGEGKADDDDEDAEEDAPSR